jgi:hypothetical protein
MRWDEESAGDEETDGELMLHAARRAAWRYTPRALHGWREDIAQDALLKALACRRRVGRTPAFVYKHGVITAVKRLAFLLRYGVSLAAEDWYEDSDEGLVILVDGPAELGPIALWRLQRAWADMTDVEKEAMACLLTGANPVDRAAELGISNSALAYGRRKVVARLDAPFRRLPSRAGSHPTDLSKPRPPIDVAALRARDSAKQLERYRRRIAAQRAAQGAARGAA